jgi:hypothetical protein
MEKREGAIVFIGMALLLSVCWLLWPRQHSDESDEGTGRDDSRRPPQRIRPETSSPKTPSQDRQAEQTIREQLALLLSTRPEDLSLDQVLRACRHLNDPAIIERLLGDPDFGWAPLAVADYDPRNLSFHSDLSTAQRVFLQEVHRALFERWGQLDFDGALERLAETGGANAHDDFDGHWASVGWLYKGAASIDGARTFEAEAFSDWGESTRTLVQPFMEGWASSDPDAAWDTLRTSMLMIQEWKSAATGFFEGLPESTDWHAMSERLEPASLGDGSFTAEGNPSYRPHFERELAKRWVQNDPDAALAWYASRPQSDERWNTSADGPIEIRNYAEILANWQRSDPEGSTAWLKNWHPTILDKGKVMQAIPLYK